MSTTYICNTVDQYFSPLEFHNPKISEIIILFVTLEKQIMFLYFDIVAFLLFLFNFFEL